MVWGAYCSQGKLPVVFLDGNINAIKYTEVLADTMFRFMNKRRRMGAVFGRITHPRTPPRTLMIGAPPYTCSRQKRGTIKY